MRGRILFEPETKSGDFVFSTVAIPIDEWMAHNFCRFKIGDEIIIKKR